MKHFLYVALFLGVSLPCMQAQVSINTDDSEPDSSAMLDVKSTDKGILIPRLTSEQRTNISHPADGLLVYDSETRSFWYFEDSTWQEIRSTVNDPEPSQADSLWVKTANFSAYLADNDNLVTGNQSLAFGLRDTVMADQAIALGRDNRASGRQSAAIGEGNTADDESAMAFGEDNAALAEASVAMGDGNGALGEAALALGYENGVFGATAIGMGHRNLVFGDTSWAIGNYNVVDEPYSFALGSENLASDTAAFVMGCFNEATGYGSFAIGNGTIASAFGAMAFGFETEAQGANSQAFGSFTTAYSGFETVFGYFNTSYSPGTTEGFNLNDRLFVVGNGLGPTAQLRSDALIIYKDGRTRINGPLTLGFSGDNLASYTLPNVRGTDGQILQINNSGIVSWSDQVINTDNQTIDQLDLQENTLRLSLEGDNEPLQTVDLSGINTDDQTIDQLDLDGNTLRLSLEGDNEPLQTVDLSGVNTDNQSLSLNQNTLSITNGNQVDLSSLIPIGTVQMWVTGTPPDGWLLCDGSTENVNDYPDLGSLLGGSPGGQFSLPDLSGRFPLGVGNNGLGGSNNHPYGETGGDESVILTESQIPVHNHDSGTLATAYPYKTRSFTGTQNDRDGSDVNLFDSSEITGNTGDTGGGEAHNNMPPYYTLYFIIKAE